MNIQALNSQFEKIGSTLKARERREGAINRRWRPVGTASNGFRLDIKTDKKGQEYFELEHEGPVQARIVDSKPDMKHLLMVVTAGELTRKFLCGFDERHFFAAGVPDNAGNIKQAFHMLQPPEVQELAKKLPRKERYKRHNAEWKRQGEWFFIPVTAREMAKLYEDYPRWDKKLVKHNEPIRRGRSKDHMCEYLFATGGEAVWVHEKHAPNGIPDGEYRQRMEKARRNNDKKALLETWQHRTRDAVVYIKGHVRHLDHATVYLPGWHKVRVNGEVLSEQMAFLD